ncbi:MULTISPECIES: hypothetical protein [Myroides]|uniref:Outer membrane protein beta-barrel domain-containing protein n=1 Tax=Myroides albus TaxID=2562892 RepID=A0A6I3LEV6_9FLAO|nr:MULTISPECIES: hypothetical protein [Myroides]MTG96743.1 hypothetical protein [Myroides albus]MVX35615.1 hypothetical protein [Myroides sp. LoEW2-1]UVD80846.1 hypothetical protein NWE55_06280 [Myroides albus]
MKRLLTLILLSFVLGSYNLKASTDNNTIPPQDLVGHLVDKSGDAHLATRFLDHLNISAGISTLGLTIEAATPLAPHLKIRAGLNYLNYNSSAQKLNIEDPQGYFLNSFGYSPRLEVEGRIKLFHAHALVDFYPNKEGVFFISGGFYFGRNTVSVKGGFIDDKGNPADILVGHEWPTLEYDGNILDLNKGRLDAEMRLGNVVKPYLGIGVGRSVSMRRIGIKLEVGMLYQGDYTLKQNGQKVTTGKEADARVEDTQKYNEWLRWWPKAELKINYRIF